ncbi:DUF2442 domain-containing protein [bacterium]|nr:MAG: DUF2442 domain-containing protein [bacterium]
MAKKLKKPGKSTSIAEVQNISNHGIWILIDDREFFLSFAQYPWFQKATVDQIYDMHFYHEKHLHWPSLDVDLEVESLKYPDAYPLIYK